MGDQYIEQLVRSGQVFEKRNKLKNKLLDLFKTNHIFNRSDLVFWFNEVQKAARENLAPIRISTELKDPRRYKHHIKSFKRVENFEEFFEIIKNLPKNKIQTLTFEFDMGLNTHKRIELCGPQVSWDGNNLYMVNDLASAKQGQDKVMALKDLGKLTAYIKDLHRLN